MKVDKIIAEIRETREAYAAKFAGDVSRMLADIRKRQEQGAREVVSLPPKRVVASQSTSPVIDKGKSP